MFKYSTRHIAEQSTELVSRQIKLILIYSKFPKVCGKVRPGFKIGKVW